MSAKQKKLKDVKSIKKVKYLTFLSILSNLIKKNTKIILRSKSSSLIVIFGPLLIIGLVGAAFNTSSLYNIKIGTYSSDYNELTGSLVTALEDNQFKVEKIDNQETCVSKLKQGEIHVCAVFPANLTIGSEEDVKFFVDKTKMNLVWLIIDTISSKVSTKSSELSLQMTTVIIEALTDADKKISEKQTMLSGMVTDTQATSQELDLMNNKLNQLDLRFDDNEIGIDKIRGRLNSVVTSLNLSSEAFSSVFSSISEAANSTVKIEKRFNNMSGVVGSIVSDVNIVKQSVSDNLQDIQSMGSVLSSISEKISAIQIKEAGKIVTPIKTNIEPVVAETTHLSNLFPTLVVLVLMFIALLVSSTLVVREKTNSAYFRNLISPTSDGMFLFGDFLTNFLVLFIQIGLIFGVAAIFFKDAIYNVLGPTALAVVVIATTFIMFGLFVGQLFKTEETSALAAVTFGSVLLFFSGTLLPLETLPEALRRITDFNPFVLGEHILKQIMLFNNSLMSVWQHLLILLGYSIILCLLVYGTRRLSKTYL